MLPRIGPREAIIFLGGYLIYPGDNTTMQVLWQLHTPESHTLRWGQDGSYSAGSATPAMYGDNQYEYTIAGLTPGAMYYYEVEEVGIGSFLAAPPDGAVDVKFLAYGDTWSDPNVHDSVNAQMIAAYASDPAYQTFTMFVGDWVRDDTESNWTDEFFNRSWQNTMQMQADLPIKGCIGNHEATNMLRKMPRKPHDLANQIHKTPDNRTARIKPGFKDATVINLTTIPPLHRAREAADLQVT